MRVQVLGAHNLVSRDSGNVSLLIDGVLAVDAGALATGLSLADQQRLRAVLLTHQHYDHMRDIPALGMNFLMHENTLEVHAARPAAEALRAHLLNGVLYPDFTARPEDKPALQIRVIEPDTPVNVHGYEVLAVPVAHGVPAVGYQVTSAAGRAVFYSADTGPGLAEAWRRIAPHLLFIEVTAPDRYEEFCRRSGHLTPALLRRELEDFRRLKGYLPPVVLLHLNPLQEREIGAEVAEMAAAIGADIKLGYEGMALDV